MTSDLFARDFKAAPYWWDTREAAAIQSADLPEKADVVIVGSGYTGLCAALETASAGRSIVVLDAEDAGWGCSTRNGGLIGNDLKPDFRKLVARHGEKAAREIIAEGPASLDWIKDFVTTQGIDCDFLTAGRFHGAHTPGRFEALARARTNRPDEADREPAEVIPKAEMHRFIDTDFYHGGVFHPEHATLNPARFHAGLLERALAAGATLVTGCRATGLYREGIGHRVLTGRGDIEARDVIVATNGYTGPLVPWLRRRIVPIGSYIIATEELPRDILDRLMPTDAALTDTREVVYYYRPSPDRRRVVFGGRVTGGETDPERAAPLLYSDLCALFPELREVRVSHAWKGTVAYTFDEMPHLGSRDGIHYSLGYCGSGVAMAGYLGTRLARRLLGLEDATRGLQHVPMKTRPFYTGNPWFMPAVVQYYRLKDRLAR